MSSRILFGTESFFVVTCILVQSLFLLRESSLLYHITDRRLFLSLRLCIDVIFSILPLLCSHYFTVLQSLVCIFWPIVLQPLVLTLNFYQDIERLLSLLLLDVVFFAQNIFYVFGLGVLGLKARLILLHLSV